MVGLLAILWSCVLGIDLNAGEGMNGGASLTNALRQNPRNRLSAVSHRDRPAGSIREGHFGIDAKTLIDRCADVPRADRQVFDVRRL